MLQATVGRSDGLAGVTPPVVVSNEAQVAQIQAQLRQSGSDPSLIVVEPTGRNTAPAVAAAALLLEPETVMAVFPADHVIVDTTSFRSHLESAVTAARTGHLVTFGIVPTRPDTGFGYIEAGDRSGDTCPVVEFVEKPDADTARRYVAGGRHLWNSGMFVFTAAVIRAELERLVPDLLETVNRAVESSSRDGQVVRLDGGFSRSPSISIDHAVMEHTNRAVVVPVEVGWSDLGSWQALWEVASPEGATVTVGAVHAVDVERSYIRSESRPVAVIGLDDVVVVETPEAVLVMDRRRAQDVRSAAEWFAQLGRS